MRQAFAPFASAVQIIRIAASPASQHKETHLRLFPVQHCHAQAKRVMGGAGTLAEGGGRRKPMSGSKQLARQERDLLVQLLRLRQACCHLQADPCPHPCFSLASSTLTASAALLWSIAYLHAARLPGCKLCVAQVGEGAVDKLKGKPMSMSAILEVGRPSTSAD